MYNGGIGHETATSQERVVELKFQLVKRALISQSRNEQCITTYTLCIFVCICMCLYVSVCIYIYLYVPIYIC